MQGAFAVSIMLTFNIGSALGIIWHCQQKEKGDSEMLSSSTPPRCNNRKENKYFLPQIHN